MFHVMLVFPALVIVGMIIACVLMAMLAILASVVGGVSAALIIKNKAAKRLALLSFSIITLCGTVCLLPFAGIYAQISGLAISLISVAVLICIGVLAGVGIRCASALQSKAVKTILTVVFALVLVAAGVLALFIPIARGLLATL